MDGWDHSRATCTSGCHFILHFDPFNFLNLILNNRLNENLKSLIPFISLNRSTTTTVLDEKRRKVFIDLHYQIRLWRFSHCWWDMVPVRIAKGCGNPILRTQMRLEGRKRDMVPVRIAKGCVSPFTFKFEPYFMFFFFNFRKLKK